MWTKIINFFKKLFSTKKNDIDIYIYSGCNPFTFKAGIGDMVIYNTLKFLRLLYPRENLLSANPAILFYHTIKVKFINIVWFWEFYNYCNGKYLNETQLD